MAGINGYLFNVGPEPSQIVDIKADIVVFSSFDIDVEVES
jgi:hypothetical protein